MVNINTIAWHDMIVYVVKQKEPMKIWAKGCVLVNLIKTNQHNQMFFVFP